MKRNTKIIIVCMVVLALLFTIYIAIPRYLVGQPDTLLRFQYACMTGVPISTGVGEKFSNGTHSIDMHCCTWIRNEIYGRDLGGLSCEERKEANRLASDIINETPP